MVNSPSFKIVGATLGAAVALAAGIVGDTAAADPPRAGTAHLWVDTSGGTCARSSTPAEYADAAACGSFSAAYSAASGGDTVRVKAGTYAPQSVGGTKTPLIDVIGEDGTEVESGRPRGGLQGLSLGGNVTVSNVDVGGNEPFVFIGGDNSTWRDSRLLESSDDDSLARGSQAGSTPEPILIYTDEADPITNAAIVNVVVEPQHVCTPGVGACPSGDVYHLESVRIDQNVDGVLLDRVTFLDGGEDNTALVFITFPNPTTPRPRNITIRNSVFGNHGGSYNIDGGGGEACENWTFAYNTFSKERNVRCGAGSSVLWVGNAGPKSPSGVNCTPGTTWTRNVWQWSSNSANCSDNTDTWVEGPNFEVAALGLDSSYQLLARSPLIDAGEAPGASDYCTGALGSADRDGDPRPQGAACDAGADER